MTLNKTIQLLAPLLLCCAAASASTLSGFNFDNDGLGTSTVFTDTSNGLSATFSSSADPGGFVVYQSIFQTLTGNVLGDPGPAGIDGLALDIGFSGDLSAITLNFATADLLNASPLTITAYENSTPVGSNTASGEFLGSGFPEGEIAFNGATFNKVVISSDAPDFAVDNISVASANTPEPGTFLLLGAGLILPGILRRR